MRRVILSAILLALLKSATAVEPVNSSRFSGLAIHGYDPVSYFVGGEPEEGNPDFLYRHDGATWAFSSLENLELFKESPEKYVPEYGGYCAYAVSQNQVADADPQAWRIVAGKLYLNYDNRVQRVWANRLVEHIRQADQNWPALLQN